jgi:prepilin-type N-terminal cleavage/methylation domain-containing protein
MHAQRRSSASDGGFSLIELIVTLSIVTVLAAMATPSFVGIVTNVRQAATLSDLGNDRTALVAYSIDNSGKVPSSTGFDPRPAGSNLVGYGWQKSAETTSYRYFTNTGATSWCLEMTNVTGAVFRISENTGSVEGVTCASLGATNY